MYKIDVDKLATPAVPEVEEEVITLDALISGKIAEYGRFKVLMDMAGAISQLQPNDEVTLIDIALDAIGCEEVEVTLDGAEEGAEKAFELHYDEEALGYAVGVTLDFAGRLGLSTSSMHDLMDDDAEVAMDEIHAVASLINGAIPEDGDLGHLVTIAMNSQVVVDSILEDEDAEITLDGITQDWSFSKTKPTTPARKGMAIVPCMRREKGEQPKKGFCKYPKTLLSGKKYKKRGGVKAEGKRKALRTARKHATDRMANMHRSQTMKLKAGSSKGTKKASKSSKRSM